MENLFEQIAPARALGIEHHRRSDGSVELFAPLDLNVNDKGTAFAGSISTMLVLTGWSAATLFLKKHGIQADVMVAESRTEYHRPVRAELRSTAELSGTEQLLTDLRERGRGRISAKSTLCSDDRPCASMTANYAVFIKE